MILLTGLFLAHLIGDFILQPYTWVQDKEANKIKSKKLYLHVLIHGLVTFAIVCLPGQKWHLAVAILVLSLLHLIIDLIKVYFQKEQYRKHWFFADQAAHFISIFLIYYFIEKPAFDLSTQYFQQGLVIVTAVIWLTSPSSLIIKMIVARWSNDIENSTHQQNKGLSLISAGSYIGVLERLFVLLFILTGSLESIGFLIAAKSILRFGNLKDDHERKLTEYVLIGTLLSFGMAIITGLLTKYLIS